MNTWKIILATMVIFGTGVVTGGLLVHREHVRLPARPRPAPVPRPVVTPPSTPGVMRLEFLRRAQRELDLSPEQRERIDKLIKESQERTRRLMEPVMPDLQAELQRTRKEFLRELTPDQRKRFDELVKAQQRPRKPGTPPAHERAGETNAPAR